MPVCENDLPGWGGWPSAVPTAAELRGENREVTPPERIVNTESWGDDWPETLNTVVFSEEDAKTRVTTMILYPSKEARCRARHGHERRRSEELRPPCRVPEDDRLGHGQPGAVRAAIRLRRVGASARAASRRADGLLLPDARLPFERRTPCRRRSCGPGAGIDRFEGGAALRSWLYRIATNVCLDMLNGRSGARVRWTSGPAREPVAANLTTLPEVTWIQPVARRSSYRTKAIPPR